MAGSCGPDDVCIGPFVVGEVPAPVLYRFLDADGTALDLSGYAARFVYRTRDGAPTTANASVTGPTNGEVTYVWTGAELGQSGDYLAEFWAGNGTQRFASARIVWRVRAPVGPAPAI